MTIPVNAQSSAPPSRRPRRRTGENRERLLVAGIIQFGISGYHGASTASIGELADVSQPHVYANFTTKQELFLACALCVSEYLAGDSSSVSTAPALNSFPPGAVDRFLLQAVAAVGEEKLEPALTEILETLQETLGEAAFFSHLQTAVQAVFARAT